MALPEVSPENAYKERYKHIASCFAALKMALSGSYVPFGVFRLYGDTCLQDALSMFMKLFMAIPTEEFHVRIFPAAFCIRFLFNCRLIG